MVHLPHPDVTALLAALGDGHCLYEPVRGADGRVEQLIGIYMNPAGRLLRDLTTEEFEGACLLERSRANGNDVAADQYLAVVESGDPMSTVLIGEGDKTYEVMGSCVRLDGRELLAMCFRDVTHELAHRERLETEVDSAQTLSRTDDLTSLPNRRGWQAALGAGLANGQALYLGIADLDRFKDYNDAHGHPAGDVLLQQLARAWSAALPKGCLLARLGGEEFGLLLPGFELGQAESLVEQLRSLVPGGQTASVGLALRRPDEPGAELMRRADEALYVAKRSGRDRVGLA